MYSLIASYFGYSVHKFEENSSAIFILFIYFFHSPLLTYTFLAISTFNKPVLFWHSVTVSDAKMHWTVCTRIALSLYGDYHSSVNSTELTRSLFLFQFNLISTHCSSVRCSSIVQAVILLFGWQHEPMDTTDNNTLGNGRRTKLMRFIGNLIISQSDYVYVHMHIHIYIQVYACPYTLAYTSQWKINVVCMNTKTKLVLKRGYHTSKVFLISAEWVEIMIPSFVNIQEWGGILFLVKS